MSSRRWSPHNHYLYIVEVEEGRGKTANKHTFQNWESESLKPRN